MSSVRRSLAYSALDSNIALLLQLVSTVVIARILTPAQTGVFAVAAVFASLASTFRDFGVAEYLIQEARLDDQAIRAAFSVNLGVSWLMALLLLGLAPLAAGFYDEPGVAAVMRVQALSFLLIPFGAVTMAWFRRELNFRPIFIANVSANGAALITAVSLALRGHGYMSLAWASLVNAAVTVAMSWLLRPAGFPAWPGLQGIGRVLSFGKFASGVYILGQIGRGAPEMIIGRTHGMAAVGIFSRGNGLVEIFNRLVLRAVLPVCLPFFSRSVRDTGSPRPGVLQAMALITGIGWPLLACLGLGAYPAIRLMYGPQWLDAVPLAPVLCLAAAIELAYFPAKEALLSQGLARESNQLQFWTQAWRIAGLLLVLPFGLAGACWGLVAAALAGSACAHLSLHRHIGLGWAEVWRATARSLIVSTVTASPWLAWQLLHPAGESNYILVACTGAAAAAAAWLLALRGTGHPLWQELRAAWARIGPRRPAA